MTSFLKDALAFKDGKCVCWTLTFVFVFFVLVRDIEGQTVDLLSHDLSHNNELSNPNAISIAQDELGFMWFGTTSGLNRFDGYEIEKYLSIDGKNYGIDDSHVYELFADSHGRLWISLESSLCVYFFETDSIKVMAHEDETRGLKNAFITGYDETYDSVLYVSDSYSIYKYEGESFVEVFSLNTGEISSFFFDEEGMMWIAATNNNRIYKYNPSTKEYSSIELPQNDLTMGTISSMKKNDGAIWIGTDGSGVWKYDLKTQGFKNYPVDNEYALNVRKIYVDKDGFLWIIDFSGLKLYVKNIDSFQGYYFDQDNEFSVKPRINTIFQDKHKNYWTLHSPGGIGFAPKPINIARFDSNINSPFRLSDNTVTAICEDENGNLWMGNSNNGIDIFWWEKGKTVSLFHEPDNENSLGKGAVLSIYRDSKNRIWIGTYWGGLQRYRPGSNDFISYKHNPDDKKTISGNDVRAIAEDKNGFLWICTHGTGIDRFDPESGEFQNFNGQMHRLSNNYTFDVAVDSNNSVWVATVWGLSVLHEGDSIFHSFFTDKNDLKSISSNRVAAVHIDNEKRLWAGTNEGLNMYLPGEEKFKRFNNGFRSNDIVSVTSDNSNNIWAGTAKGLSRLDAESGQVMNLEKEHGLISNVFSPRTVYKNDFNTLFFGTQHGLNYFNASNIEINNTPPKVYITNVHILGNEYNLHNSSVIEKNIVVADKIVLDHSHKRFSFEFSALNYINPENNNYAYFLEGFETAWNYTGSKREAIFTNLNPGKYTLRVKAANNQGIWNDEVVSLDIYIKGPFWKTFWFKFTAFVLVIGFIALFLKIKGMRSEKIQRELEIKVAERTNQIETQKDKLLSQKEELLEANALKDRFISILAHDLRSPVYSLVQLTDLMQEKINVESEPIGPKFVGMIARSAKTTYNLLEDLLIWGRSKSGKIEFDFENLNLYAIAEHVIKGYVLLSESKNIKLINNIPENFEVYADKNSLKVVIRNLLSNALKFSNTGQPVSLNAKVENDKVVVSVADKGIGMSNELKNNLLGKEEMVHSGKGTAGEEGSGLGITLCKDLLYHNNGGFWIESIVKKGTTVFFSLPCKK
jgi:ligand-binding sensor domain-containing protein/signal transduction histidine kinase